MSILRAIVCVVKIVSLFKGIKSRLGEEMGCLGSKSN